MKTFLQFNEDIDQRRKQLRQRQLDQMSAHKQKVASYHAAQKEKHDEGKEREKLKSEIKRELQAEQVPVMVSKGEKPNLYNQLVARRQASQKSAHIKHVHQELGAEARSEREQRGKEMKAIMSRRTV